MITRKPGEQGFSLALLTVCLIVMLGMVGVTYDLGRMYIVKNELQTFVDASALAAVAKMDGTKTGIDGANATATAGPLGTSKPNGYDFDSKTISPVTATYASNFTDTYDSYAVASSNATNTYRFINITASAALPMTFLPVLPGIPTSMTITATATAGQQAGSSVSNGGLAPFVSDAHDATDTKNFGFTENVSYTMKWGNKNVTDCAGDSGFPAPPNAPSAHGFVDLGQGSGSSGLRGVIVYGGYPNANSTPSSVYPGMQLFSASGNKGSSIYSTLAERSNQDPDQTSTTWEAYKAAGTGNYRRVMTVPVDDPATWAGTGGTASVTVVGFANFLLAPGSTISGNSGSICASYIGPGDLTGTGAGGTDGTKVYSNMLYK
jgi:Flp pilus assembly protein TadG